MPMPTRKALVFGVGDGGVVVLCPQVARILLVLRQCSDYDVVSNVHCA